MENFEVFFNIFELLKKKIMIEVEIFLQKNKKYLRQIYFDIGNFSNLFLYKRIFNYFLQNSIQITEMKNRKHIYNEMINLLTDIDFFTSNKYQEYKNLLKSFSISSNLFSTINDSLDKFTWSLDEQNLFHINNNKKKDKLLYLTPEILSKLNEKQRDPKKSGVYYTPSNIALYITDNAVNIFLIKELNKKFQKSYKNLLDIFDKSQAIEIKYLLKLLTELKICDISCGCGVFLLASMFILDKYYKKCIKILGIKYFSEINSPQNNFKIYDNNYSFHIKEFIMMNNIYGVDVDKNSILISKLRIWLNLLSEYLKNHKNSNKKHNIVANLVRIKKINKKIKAGNSLIGYGRYQKNEKQNEVNIKISTEIKNSSQKEINDKNYFSDLKFESKNISQDQLIKKLSDDLNPFHWRDEFSKIFEEDGFHIILGNPPYVRQEIIASQLEYYDFKHILDKIYRPQIIEDTCNEAIYFKKMDLSMFFLLRGHELLKSEGICSYIMTKKWIRTKFGKLLRHYLKKNSILYEFIDCKHLNIFPNVSVNLCIILFEKRQFSYSNSFHYYLPNSLELDKIKDKYDLIDQQHLQDNGWSFLSPIKQKIKHWIEENCISIKELNLKILRGITTGFNEGFIVPSIIRNKLVNLNHKNKELLQPLLRGRDINRFFIEWKKLWLIGIPPHFTLNKIPRTCKSKPEEWFKSNYQEIYNHLSSFHSVISKGKGLTERINQGDFWWELNPCNTVYFNQPKIMWREICNKPMFAYVHSSFYANSKGYLMTGDNIKSLLPILNSEIMDFQFRIWGTNLNMGKNIMERMHICKYNKEFFSILSDYLIIHHSELLMGIINLIVYEEYFYQIFTLPGKDQIYNKSKKEIQNRIKNYLKPVEFEEWIILHDKNIIESLNPTEKREFKRISKNNQKIINQFLDDCINDYKISELKIKINSHHWVKQIKSL